MSTAAADHSEGMFSWFPAFLPLRRPLTVQEGSEVVLNVWRRSEGGKMWYEWSCAVHQGSTVQQLPIQNADGASFSVNL